MTYNTIVAKLKEIARDGLRMELVSKRQTEVAAFEANIKSHQENIQELRKDIERANFQITQLVDADPDFADKKKAYEDQIVEIEADIKTATECLDEVKKQKTEVEENITKIEAGEVKVNLERLNDRTAQLITEVTTAAAVKAVSETTNR